MEKEQQTAIDRLVSNKVHLEFAAEPNERVIENVKRMLLGAYAQNPNSNSDTQSRKER